MTEDTAKKARNILDRLDKYRNFLKEYDKCSSKTIVVKQDWLSSLCDTLDFSHDRDFDDEVRKYVVRKISDLEKQLEEIDMSTTNLQEACRIITNELQKHGDFYNAFVASIRSAILEVPEEIWSIELAEKIVKRISGEE